MNDEWHSLTSPTHTKPFCPRFSARCQGQESLAESSPSIRDTDKNADGSICQFNGGGHRRPLSTQVSEPPYGVVKKVLREQARVCYVEEKRRMT